MSRIAMAVEYDGTAFYGWQIQKDGRDVQSCVEHALSVVANEPVKAVCAGRTDSGVHAIGQVIHFDTSARRGERSWVLGVNSNLPDDVNATWARVVAPDFHARFSAKSKIYNYRILNRSNPPAINRQYAWHIGKTLDLDAMRTALPHFIGRQDFKAFEGAGSPRSSTARARPSRSRCPTAARSC